MQRSSEPVSPSARALRGRFWPWRRPRRCCWWPSRFRRCEAVLPTPPAAGQGTSSSIRPRLPGSPPATVIMRPSKRELRQRGYPMQSVFNWRTPLPVWLVAVLPQGWAQVLLMGTAGVMWLLGLALLGHEFGRLGIAAGMATISGAVLPCLLDEVFIMPEVWAGVLIGLSAAAYGTERNRLGCLAALAALLVRELAAPWCLVCLVFDVRARGRRAAAVWAVGFAVYAALYALHLGQVLPRIAAERRGSGARLGPFRRSRLLDFDRADEHLAAAGPAVAGGLYLAVALVGAAGWSSPAGKRIAWGVVLYAVAFSVAGQAINQYWGSLTAPLFALSAAAAPAGLARLWRAANLGRAAVAGPQAAAG